MALEPGAYEDETAARQMWRDLLLRHFGDLPERRKNPAVRALLGPMVGGNWTAWRGAKKWPNLLLAAGEPLLQARAAQLGGSEDGEAYAKLIVEVASKCQSANEVAFLLGIDTVAQTRGLAVSHDLTDAEENALSYPRLLIAAQAKVGNPKVDFLLTFEFYADPIKRYLREREAGRVDAIPQYRPSTLPESVRLVVECDSYQAHGRVSQAKRDRIRDRSLLRRGIPVFRFWSDELREDPIACAVEAVDFLVSGAEEPD